MLFFLRRAQFAYELASVSEAQRINANKHTKSVVARELKANGRNDLTFPLARSNVSHPKGCFFMAECEGKRTNSI